MNLKEKILNFKFFIAVAVIVIVVIFSYTAMNNVQKDTLSRNLTINNTEVLRLYSYVNNARYFSYINDNDEIVFIDEKLFTDHKVLASSLSNDYKMSMAFATFDTNDKIAKKDFNDVYRNIFGSNPTISDFESYVLLNYGHVSLEGDNYVFDAKDYALDGYQSSDGVVLVDVKRQDQNIELYEALYNSSQKDQTIEYYDKNGDVFFTRQVDNYNYDIDSEVIKDPSYFKQYKIIFTKASGNNYYLTSVEPYNN